MVKRILEAGFAPSAGTLSLEVRVIRDEKIINA